MRWWRERRRARRRAVLLADDDVDRPWSDSDWRPLLIAIRAKKCTPFLGAGACAGVLPLGSDIAREWAKASGYPFPDCGNLPRVAQFRAVHDGSLAPKLELQTLFQNKGQPDFLDESEPHRVISDLRLPVYITTNYDQFLLRAIETDNVRDPKRKRTPRSVICPWHSRLRRNGQAPRGLIETEPTPDEPLIFHMHGRIDKDESMVLTEDDYLDFLMVISEKSDDESQPQSGVIPPRIEEAFASTSLLFLGYSLEDMNFKVIFRKLATFMGRAEGARHVSVQLAPAVGEDGKPSCDEIRKQRRYLEEHFKLQHVKIYWGTCREFVAELRRRWNAFNQ